MLEKIDIILQGKITEMTRDIIECLLDEDFVDNVVLSCWESCDEFVFDDPRVQIVRSKDVSIGGITNRNRQIVSTLAGLRHSKAKFVAKMRTDQKIEWETLQEMHRFYFANKERRRTFYAKHDLPRNRICVGSIFVQFPFHPKDFWFWGNRLDLIDVFSLPLDLRLDATADYNENVRSETYLAQFYVSNFDRNVQKMIDNPKLYLTDSAPLREEAMKLSQNILADIFTPFPNAHFRWPKYYGQIDLYHLPNGHPEMFSEPLDEI